MSRLSLSAYGPSKSLPNGDVECRDEFVLRGDKVVEQTRFEEMDQGKVKITITRTTIGKSSVQQPSYIRNVESIRDLRAAFTLAEARETAPLRRRVTYFQTSDLNTYR